jgi:hypothetical protein
MRLIGGTVGRELRSAVMIEAAHRDAGVKVRDSTL